MNNDLNRRAMSSRCRLTRALPAAAGFLFMSAAATTLADSGIGVDTWRANKLDPTGGQAADVLDLDGTSWLKSGQHRSPTGNLYLNPIEPLHPDDLSVWQIYGTFDLGYLHTDADKVALYDRYTRWPTNGAAFDFDMNAERPSDGSYAEARGSRVSEEDQYYQAVYGKVGAYSIEAFVRDVPNVLSTDAKAIWNGVGTNSLTLPSSLTPGTSSSAQVADVSAGTAVRRLEVDRKKYGIGLSTYLTPQWTAYLNLSDEQREGARPYGGPFGEDWGGGIGAILETVKPIDDATINLNTGARYASEVWRADIGFSGSFYRDKYLSYSFQQPFAIGSVAQPGTIATPVTVGQMSMEPDNDYYNLHGALTRVLPMHGELSLTISEVLMRQNDRLIPPTNCQGVIGMGTPSSGSTQLGVQNLGPQNPQLYSCGQWNTPAALSQQTADVSMRNTLAEAKIALQPSTPLSVNAGAKFYRQDYDNNYIAYNPSNGYYGYLAENAAFFRSAGVPGSIVSGDSLNSANPPPFIIPRIRPFLLSMDEYNAYGGVSWKFTARDTVGLTYNFDQYRPTSRERDHVNDNSIKLTWIDKSLNWLTLRANYTYLNQSGNIYNGDVYGYTFLSALPSFVSAYPNYVSGPETVDALRKYDIADRNEHKVDLMATASIREDMTVTGTVRGDWNAYPAQIGRQGNDTFAATLQWEWQPAPATGLSIYLDYDHSSLHISNIAGNFLATDGALGGSDYPLANLWWEADEERNYSAGTTLRKNFGPISADLGWNYLYSRGVTSYTAASPGALAFPQDFPTIGTGFTPMIYRMNSVTASVTVPFTPRVSMRVFDSYERGQINDWHYAGFNQSLVSGNTLYTDGGPQSYSQNLVGIFLSVKL
jgi:Putative outer membrane beta-barrel porin, MtrB/PioB